MSGSMIYVKFNVRTLGLGIYFGDDETVQGLGFWGSEFGLPGGATCSFSDSELTIWGLGFII